MLYLLVLKNGTLHSALEGERRGPWSRGDERPCLGPLQEGPWLLVHVDTQEVLGKSGIFMNGFRCGLEVKVSF